MYNFASISSYASVSSTACRLCSLDFELLVECVSLSDSWDVVAVPKCVAGGDTKACDTVSRSSVTLGELLRFIIG